MEAKQLLRFGSEKHTKISKDLHDRLMMSSNDLSDRFTQFAANEEQFRAYIPEKDDDAIRRQKRKNGGFPAYTTIEVPYSYAQVLTAHTYYSTVFLSRNPIFQMQGVHGEGQQQEQAVEALMNYQTMIGNMLVPLYVWLLDPGRYGYGVVGHYWDKEKTTVRQKVQKPKTFLGIPTGVMETVDEVNVVTGYEGNRLYNVRPQDWFPDTRLPLNQFQRGEFCARYVELTWIDLSNGGRSGKYFNLEEVKKATDNTSTSSGLGGTITRDPGSSAVSDLPNMDGKSFNSVPKTGVVKAYEIYVRLRPSDWGLADGDAYEVWVFTMTTTDIIVGAQPHGAFHGKFPFDIIEYEPNGYNLTSQSMLEGIKPLNDVMTWLINTHFYNVRATLNNQFIVDPSMITMSDLESPEPGFLLRAKPAAYGRDVRSFITQLPVSDVTRQNISDVPMVADMMQRWTGINDNIMGLLDPGGRKTATEVRSSTSFGVSRLKTNCEYFSAMGFSPLSQKLLQNTQQYYDGDKQFRLVGNLAEFSPSFAKVTPDDIAGFYQFIPVDGTMPIDRFAQANLWQMLLGQMAQIPGIMQSYDIAKIFGFVASLAGIKNISQFRVQVVPDQQMGQQVAAGNSVPMTPPNPTEPQQIPGMGQTT
jgi:hypothetical protein